MNTIYYIFGYIGGFIVSFLVTPQIYHTYKSKDVSGLSKIFCVAQVIMTLCFIVYSVGVWKSVDFETAAPILIPNIMGCLWSNVLLFMKIKWEDNENSRVGYV